MDIVKAFTDAWDIFSKNFVMYGLATLVVVILGMATIGILYIPLIVGLQMMFVKAKRGEKVILHDLFNPFKHFFDLFFGSIWIAILVLLGLCLLIVPGLCFAAWWMYAPLFIADKGKHIGQAMRASKEMVRGKNLWTHLLLLVLGGVVANMGFHILWIGFLITMPIGWGAIACAYADETK